MLSFSGGRRGVHTVLALAAVAAFGSGVGACSSTPDAPSTSANYHGDRLAQPVVLSRPARTAAFRSTAGGTTTLAKLQRGNLMLLYFGYTHCPDVCPTTMADLGVALRQLPPIVQGHTQVVFVTSDPARDTTQVMKTWLHNFDPTLPKPFVGLTASLHQIDSVAKSVGVPLDPPVKQKDGSITVQHGAQTLAFARDEASVLWTAGTTPAEYAHDIQSLITTVAGS